MSAGSLDVVDKLTHTIKNLDKIIENYDGYSGGYTYDDGMSMARGRRRDSMGRYSSDRGYSRRYSMDNREMMQELKELMNDAPDERTRQEFQRFISKMEQM